MSTYRLHGSAATLTKSAACAQKKVGATLTPVRHLYYNRNSIGCIWIHLGGICEAPGSHLDASGTTTGGIWESSGCIWNHLGGIWEAPGRHQGGIWEASGRPGLPGWPQGDLRGQSLKKVLPLSAIINFFMKKY